VEKGAHFEVTLTIEGVYDYYCMPHELAGMVGRIIVGKPSGPGALPFDYFEGTPEASSWKPVPPEARKAFPSVETIMKRKVVRRTWRGGVGGHVGPPTCSFERPRLHADAVVHREVDAQDGG
jgi:hypothetical protein